jgi:hypothetical protein
VSRVRERDDDPQGWVRVLYVLWVCRGLRVIASMKNYV